MTDRENPIPSDAEADNGADTATDAAAQSARAAAASEAAASKPAAEQAETVEATRRRRPAQFGTIFWGFLLLALCGFVAVVQFGPPSVVDRYTWLFVGVIAAGVALVAVGIAAAFRRS